MAKQDLSNIKTLNDKELLATTLTLVSQERQLTADILHYLAEIEWRRLYAKWGYASMWEFATKELRYSSGAAYRRIDAMRLVKTLTPDDRNETYAALNDGRLNLTAVNAVTQFLKDEKKENGKIYCATEKKKILDQVQGKSKPECERILASVNPVNYEKAKRHVDQTRALSADRLEVCFAMGPELAGNLEQIKNLWAHHFKTPPTYEELLLKMSEVVLARIDPLRKPLRKLEKVSNETEINTECGTIIAITTNLINDTGSKLTPRNGESLKYLAAHSIIQDTEVKQSSAVEVGPSENTGGTARINKSNSRANRLLSPTYGSVRRPYISVELKRAIWQRDQGQCTYVDSKTARRCSSKHRLQIDHRTPYCLGGVQTMENLSLKCQPHNALLAFEKLGSDYMAKFMSGKVF